MKDLPSADSITKKASTAKGRPDQRGAQNNFEYSHGVAEAQLIRLFSLAFPHSVAGIDGKQSSQNLTGALIWDAHKPLHHHARPRITIFD